MTMKVCIILLLFVTIHFGNGGQIKTSPSIKYLGKPNNDITIKIMIHIDKALTRKLAKEYKLKTRKELKTITKGLLEDARKLFTHKSLNQTIHFKIINIKFFRNGKSISMEENASKYLNNYCDWQSKKKFKERTLYYSVLLTGLDLFHVNNGKLVKSNSGRSFTKGICSVRKSCAIIEWRPKIVGFLLAHEIGHSLGMRHDGPPYNYCNDQKNVMALRYDVIHPPAIWSRCSLYSLRQFLQTSKSWCVKSQIDHRTMLDY